MFRTLQESGDSKWETGSSIDLVSELYVSPEFFTGEVTWIRHPLDAEAKFLSLAKITLERNFEIVHTKADVPHMSIVQERYLIRNRTFELIKGLKSSEEGIQQLITLTRAQAKRNSRQAKKGKRIDSSHPREKDRPSHSLCRTSYLEEIEIEIKEMAEQDGVGDFLIELES